MSKTATYRIPTTGGIEQISISVSSLDQASAIIPAGAYTTFRTFNRTRAIEIDEHFSRLVESAQLAASPVSIRPDEIRQNLRQLLSKSTSGESRVRLTLDLTQTPGDVYISIEPLSVPPPEAYMSGVKVLLKEMHRNNPKAKLSQFIRTAGIVRHTLAKDINEVLMVKNGIVLEGLSSNFFGICSGEIWTANEGVLSGITRKGILEICAKKGIVVHFQGLPLTEISNLEEAFISSASRAVLPVVEIDGKPVGGGMPGSITKALLAAYQEYVLSQAEEI